jgi:phosphoribosylaminoimidazolecarboxamide formyltransferase/IMP cyclohydrolase
VTVEALPAPTSRSRSGRPRLAVGVSGQGSNLRALQRGMQRALGHSAGDSLGAEVAFVFADRDCPALAFAAANGIATTMIAPADYPDHAAWDRAVATVLRDADVDFVVLAGFMRRLGNATLESFAGRILNVHPSLLPAFPGAHAVADALAAGVKVTGVTIHLVDANLDAGPIVMQEAVPVLPDDDAASLLERLHAVEHRLLPRAVALLAAEALRVEGRSVTADEAKAAALPARRRALLSVSDKTGIRELATSLARLGYELVSTGGTARALRDAGLDVVDVASVTGFPEMLDGRVKTLHPRIEAGVLADLRRADHRAQLVASAIEPFDLVVVNLYPFAAAAARPGISTDELIEEIDIGGPTLVRAAAKNHASVAIITSPGDYPAVVRELEESGGIADETRRRLASEAFAHTAAYDARIAAVLPERLGVPQTAAAGAGADSLPERLTLELSLVERLRYGENPHQGAALYRLPAVPAAAGPFAAGVVLLQGKPLSYNNILDASAAAALVREFREPACVIVKHANPCGAAEAATSDIAWERALSADPVSAFGGVVAFNRPLDDQLAHGLTSLFLEVVVAPGLDATASAVLAAKQNLRVVLDPSLGSPAVPAVEYRSAGGGLLATESDVGEDDPTAWRTATRREPTDSERQDLTFAWRVVRHVKSNAIVLVRDRAVVGVGAGQMSRVDSAKLAVAKAGPERARGAVSASDAFYPFPDGVEVCIDAGVSAFIQPGGSLRDNDVVAAADRGGAAMLVTGVRHFRH